MPSGPRLLLLDDNPNDRPLILQQLRREIPGLQVTEIPSGAGFARTLEGKGSTFTVVLPFIGPER